jgi:hypothetical protein
MKTELALTRNPFTASDPHRREIWDILMQRDFEAFVAVDWAMIESDFWQEGFCGIDARRSFDPDQWRITFPNLEAYRDEWLRQACEFSSVQLLATTMLEFFFDSCRLHDIEIEQGRAVARKKFNGKAMTVNGEEIILRFQTFYQMVRRGNRWAISGFVGYLPYSELDKNGNP